MAKPTGSNSRRQRIKPWPVPRREANINPTLPQVVKRVPRRSKPYQRRRLVSPRGTVKHQLLPPFT